MEAVTTSTSLSTAITNNAAPANSVNARANREFFERMPDYEGQITWRYLDGRVCVANEWDGNGSARLGAITYRDGSMYVGPIVKGVPNGKGHFKSAKNSTYEGEFRFGRINGEGYYKTFSGATYVGRFTNGKMDGKGKAECIGETYVGEFQNNVRQGFGELSMNGSRYTGQFCAGIPHGIGTLTNAIGEVFSGQFVFSKPDGVGILRHKGEFSRVEYVMGHRFSKVSLFHPDMLKKPKQS